MRHVLLFVLFGGCRGLLGIDEAVPLPADGPSGVDGTPTDATNLSDVPLTAFRMRVRALIDGRSQLVLRDRTVYWRHYTFTAPGRWMLPVEATTFDQIQWLPTWPDIPTFENRDCNCNSSSTQLAATVPTVPALVTLEQVQARKPPTVVQSPAPENDYTAIVELSDEGFSGAAYHAVDIVVTPQ